MNTKNLFVAICQVAYIINLKNKPYCCSDFSSPGSKAQLSCSDRNLFFVRILFHGLLYFRLLIQNHWATFKQTWNKAFLGFRKQMSISASPRSTLVFSWGDNFKCYPLVQSIFILYYTFM